jgi:hypothetical protein
MKLPSQRQPAELVSTTEAAARNARLGLTVGRKKRGFGFKPHADRANPKYPDIERMSDAIKLFISKCAEAATKGKLRASTPTPSKMLRRNIHKAGGNVEWLFADADRRNKFVEEFFRILRGPHQKVGSKAGMPLLGSADKRSGKEKLLSRMQIRPSRKDGERDFAMAQSTWGMDRVKKPRKVKDNRFATPSRVLESQDKETRRKNRSKDRKHGVAQEWNWVIAQAISSKS